MPKKYRSYALATIHETMTLKIVREFVRSLGDALRTLSPAEIYVWAIKRGRQVDSGVEVSF